MRHIQFSIKDGREFQYNNKRVDVKRKEDEMGEKN